MNKFKSKEKLQVIFIKFKNKLIQVKNKMINIINNTEPLIFLFIASVCMIIYFILSLYNVQKFKKAEDLGKLSYSRILIMPFPDRDDRFQLMIPSIDGTTQTSLFVSKDELDSILMEIQRNLKQEFKKAEEEFKNEKEN